MGEFIVRWDGVVLAVALCGMLVAWLQGSLRFERLTAEQRKEVDRIAARERSASLSLAERNRQLELTEEIAEIGHWRLDLESNGLFWSDGIARIHGIEPGKTPPLAEAIDFYHPEDRETVAAHVEEGRANGTPWIFRARLIAADGTHKYVEARGQPELDPQGNPVALFGMLADRSGEYRMRSEVEAERDRANEVSRAKAAFLSRLSHQLREPAATVVGYSDMLSREVGEPNLLRSLEQVSRSAGRITEILDDVLDLAQVEAGAMSVDVAPTDLGALLKDIVDRSCQRAREKHLSLSLRVDESVPAAILTDERRLRQIVENLVANAIIYTDSGFIVVAAKAVDGMLKITVRDTGIGIDPAAHKVIFEEFRQLPVNVARPEGGIGLGLPIGRQLARMLGGQLMVDSTPGNGSTFTLSIPCRRSEATPRPHRVEPPQEPALPPARSAARQPAPSPRPASRKRAQPGRVLLAEDHEINQLLIVKMGYALGLAVDVAENGQVAIDMVRAADEAGTPYALVLMDLQMPVMTGLEACLALREAGWDAERLPILAISANAFPDDVKACADAGMQGHIAKPVTLERLAAAVRPYVQVTRAAGKAA
ncbi:ATP-binding protein [Alteriqipengyuania flavescens]|uniref:PAS domain-containing hybrid sensor histidine kinase/response regulator n=1 Tax=Alteriqipengyuania flavescens TaxID=3053610 RepID=UPI0025B4C965|nr:PAS domain-containing hybrid sensor histidine kinase/response regulator [Alteriqipengyuania flavescens]WJY19350.1 ATP-binding protein [Alteriqipengyuania flavescens]WJY25292.1 ATP-binding protein [Alteriqipengyuania flavescens]